MISEIKHFLRYNDLCFSGVHSTIILGIALFTLFVFCRLLYKQNEILALNHIINEQGCLHLRGMNHYTKDLKKLLKIHVTQILRLRRSIPAVIIPRVIVVASIIKKTCAIMRWVPSEENGNVDQLQLRFNFCSLKNIETTAILLKTKNLDALKLIVKILEKNAEKNTDNQNAQSSRNRNTFINRGQRIEENPNLSVLNPLIDNSEYMNDYECENQSSGYLKRILYELNSISDITMITRRRIESTSEVVKTVVLDFDANKLYTAQEYPNLNMDIFLVLLKTNGDLPELHGDWMDAYVGGIPLAQTYAEIIHYRLIEPNCAKPEILTIFPLHVFHCADILGMPESLESAVYYSRFEQLYGSQPTSNSFLGSLLNYNQISGIQNSGETASGQTSFWRNLYNRVIANMYNALSENARQLFRLNSRPTSYPLERRESLILNNEPKPVPPTLTQWVESTSIQEDLGIFGFMAGEDRDCLICMSRRKDVTLLPCRHSSCCSDCLKSFRQEKCPICRSLFYSYVIFPLRQLST